uniref:Peptidase S49 domain-containing protein n=1 Tax=Strombidium inclinatum TaxID=197538 RepID=A0A7S3IFF7_9SPIT|mmetsp:Transcript_15961/g.24727  ORF Transcript_15961/g.24727 Transcript_15961/m.24727 type:complete len:201 (+) Transcript_15961:294-896(+)
MYGDTILADRCTMMGNIGYRMTPWLMKEMLREKLWDSKVEFRHAGENKVRFNRFKDLRQEDVEWALNLFNNRVDYIVDAIAKKRGTKLTNEGRDLLASGETILGAEAHRLGIVDLLQTPDVYFHDKMPGQHIAFARGSWKQKLGLASTLFSADFSVSQDQPAASLVDQLSASEQEVALLVEEAMMDVLCRQNVRLQQPLI